MVYRFKYFKESKKDYFVLFISWYMLGIMHAFTHDDEQLTNMRKEYDKMTLNEKRTVASLSHCILFPSHLAFGYILFLFHFFQIFIVIHTLNTYINYNNYIYRLLCNFYLAHFLHLYLFG